MPANTHTPTHGHTILVETETHILRTNWVRCRRIVPLTPATMMPLDMSDGKLLHSNPLRHGQVRYGPIRSIFGASQTHNPDTVRHGMIHFPIPLGQTTRA